MTGKPLRLSFLEVGQENVYYRSLFALVDSHPDLLRLRELMAGHLNVSAADYMPHLSLLYSLQRSSDAKNSLVEQLQREQILDRTKTGLQVNGIASFEVCGCTSRRYQQLRHLIAFRHLGCTVGCRR